MVLYRKWKGLKRWIKAHQDNEEIQDEEITELKKSMEKWERIWLEFFEKNDYKYYVKKIKEMK